MAGDMLTVNEPAGRARRGALLSRWLPADLPRTHLAATAVTAATAALCPLPFGSVSNFWALVWTIPLALALPLFSLRRLRAAHLPIVLGAGALTFAVIAAVLLQTAAGPSVAPAHPIWAAAGQALSLPLAGTVSVDPVQSWLVLCRPVLLLLAFLCGFAAALEREGARLVFRVAAYSGLAYAVYALAAHLLDPASLLGIEKLAYVEDLTGTFVNRNTAGTFFGMITILWWARVLTEIDGRVPRSAGGPRDWAAALLDAPPRALVLAALAWFLVLAALFLTRSRAGVLLSLGSLVAVTLLVMRHRLSATSGALGAAAILALVAALTLELFAGAVAGRIGQQGLVDQGRLSGFASALAIIADHPLLGTGLGTFADVFPAYRSPAIPTAGTWDRAHNTPLEIGVELGAPIAVAAALLWAAGLWRLLAGALRRRRDVLFPAAAFAIGLLGSLHALVDFSPQIPGFAVMWLVLLGAGVAQAYPSEAGRNAPAPGTPDAAFRLPAAGDPPRRLGAAVRVAFAAVAALALVHVARRLPAETTADPVVTLADQIVGGQDFSRLALERYEPHIGRAEADGTCGPLRGAVAVIRTYLVQQAAGANDARRAFDNVQAALRGLRQKLACAPEDGLSWFTLFTLDASLRGRTGADFPLLLMSYRIAPNEGHLMRMRSQLGTAVLRVAGPELRSFVKAEFVLLARDDPRTAAGLLAGAGEPLRAVLVPLLEGIDLDGRAEIARQLADANVDIRIPGVPEKR